MVRGTAWGPGGGDDSFDGTMAGVAVGGDPGAQVQGYVRRE